MEYPIWYKQSGFCFQGGEKTLYIDPWEVPASAPKADFLFLTHAHFDHFDPETIARLRSKKTQIIAPIDVVEKLGGDNITAVQPNETYVINGIAFETVPAYNLQKEFHPRANGWVGYVITFLGTRYYHAGDTDAIPEMRNVKADVALLPIGGTYTMDVDDALMAVDMLKPQITIPMHYGFVVGSPEDADRFKRLATLPVEILAPRIPFKKSS